MTSSATRRIFLIGDRRVRRHVAPLRGRARRHDADRRARPAGRRRGAASPRPRLATITADVQRRGARRRDRHLDGVDRHRVRDRAARRRLARRASRPGAAIFLDQRAVRARHRRARSRIAMSPRAQPTGARRARVDVVGGLLCALGLAGPVFALIEERRARLGRPVDPGHASSAASPSFALVHLVGAARRRSPMLPLRLFRRRNFTFANVETLTVYAAPLDAHLLPRALPPADRRLLALPERASRLVPITIVMFLLSPRVGRAVDAASGRASSWASGR